MLRGRPEELKSEANFLTDDNELRSNSMASTLALEIAFTICSLASLPAAMFLTAITTWAPRSARTRAVSVPIPLDAPATSIPLVLHIDVAGASSGIGTETARVLALRGAHVVMAVRNMAAGKDAREQIVKAIPTAKVDAMKLDLSSLSSVRKFASDLSSLSSVRKVDAYFQSKLANILHANELARRLKEEGADITANSLHPGAIVTNLFRYNNAVNGFVKVLGRAVFKNVKQGPATTCYVALHPQVEGVTGEYFWDSNLSKPCRQGQDAEMAKKLWDFSMDLTK